MKGYGKIASVGILVSILLVNIYGHQDKETIGRTRNSSLKRHKKIFNNWHKRTKIGTKKTVGENNLEANFYLKDSNDAKGISHRKSKIGNSEEIRRLVNCKLQRGQYTIESRYVICNGKRHKVTPKVQKILRQFTTRRDMLPVEGMENKDGGPMFYGKPITSFLDDPSLPQISTSTSPHNKYPSLSLFDPGLHGPGSTISGAILTFQGSHHANHEAVPEAPGEDTPQLAPPEQPSVDKITTVSKSEEPSEDLKKKFGVGYNDEGPRGFDEDKHDDNEESNNEKEKEDSDSDSESESNPDEDNQYKTMRENKPSKVGMHEIDSFVHDTNKGGSTEVRDHSELSQQESRLALSNHEREPQYGGPVPEESKDAAVREAVHERDQDSDRANMEDSKLLRDQSIRESEEEHAKIEAENEAEKIAKESLSKQNEEAAKMAKDSIRETNNEANSLGMPGLATNDDMPSPAPLGSIWSSLRNTFYATTQSQLGENDPTSNSISRGKVHRPTESESSTGKVNQRKSPNSKRFHKKLTTQNSSDYGKSVKKFTLNGGKKNVTLLNVKVKKSEISKADEALVPLDVVRNLLMHSKEFHGKEDEHGEKSKKSSKRNKTHAQGHKRYEINDADDSGKPDYGYVPSQFMRYGFRPLFPSFENARQIVPRPIPYSFTSTSYLPFPEQRETATYQDITRHSFPMNGNEEPMLVAKNQIFSPYPPPGYLSDAMERDQISQSMMPQMSGSFPGPSMLSMFPNGPARGILKGFISVPIVEPVPQYGARTPLFDNTAGPFREATSPYRDQVSQYKDEDSLYRDATSSYEGEPSRERGPEQLSGAVGHQEPGDSDSLEEHGRLFDQYESISSPQPSTLPHLYRDPQYDPTETEAPDARPQVFQQMKKFDSSVQQAIVDAEQARMLAMRHMNQFETYGDENPNENEHDEPGYKRSQSKTKKNHKQETGSTGGASKVEKKDGKIVFTKEKIGFGPITVEAKTANAPLHDDDEDNDDD